MYPLKIIFNTDVEIGSMLHKHVIVMKHIFNCWQCVNAKEKMQRRNFITETSPYKSNPRFALKGVFSRAKFLCQIFARLCISFSN